MVKLYNARKRTRPGYSRLSYLGPYSVVRIGLYGNYALPRQYGRSLSHPQKKRYEGGGGICLDVQEGGTIWLIHRESSKKIIPSYPTQSISSRLPTEEGPLPPFSEDAPSPTSFPPSTKGNRSLTSFPTFTEDTHSSDSSLISFEDTESLDEILGKFTFEGDDIFLIPCEDIRTVIYGFPLNSPPIPRPFKFKSSMPPRFPSAEMHIDVDSLLWNLSNLPLTVPITIFPNLKTWLNITGNHAYIYNPGLDKSILMSNTPHCLFGEVPYWLIKITYLVPYAINGRPCLRIFSPWQLANWIPPPINCGSAD
ncbi:hypothetical protein BJ684DRAFT_17906 [Piptocephalis cylindrospora]|uniref:Uncharacterized protein n=1 Tax=Piptocephalis cylindrospora TaxID=1907219 RepID=A0A4V1IXL8_9FUNG|nr:hypothetical protein BJ684DRAFT_17906 [Piptocephalis cylindrospora]|eukprot:RKP11509.1 hypothetical protein BJ684DRAFT_17906 [Piptocephalis cylindrospora]